MMNDICILRFPGVLDAKSATSFRVIIKLLRHSLRTTAGRLFYDDFNSRLTMVHDTMAIAIFSNLLRYANGAGRVFLRSEHFLRTLSKVLDGPPILQSACWCMSGCPLLDVCFFISFHDCVIGIAGESGFFFFLSIMTVMDAAKDAVLLFLCFFPNWF